MIALGGGKVGGDGPTCIFLRSSPIPDPLFETPLGVGPARIPEKESILIPFIRRPTLSCESARLIRLGALELPPAVLLVKLRPRVGPTLRPRLGVVTGGTLLPLRPLPPPVPLAPVLEARDKGLVAPRGGLAGSAAHSIMDIIGEKRETTPR